MELYKGRPDTNEGRLEREIRVYDFLDDHGIEYWRTDHAPADTMEVCSEIDAVLGATICKNLFLCNRQKTQFYLLMMPGDKPFKTKEITARDFHLHRRRIWRSIWISGRGRSASWVS